MPALAPFPLSHCFFRKKRVKTYRRPRSAQGDPGRTGGGRTKNTAIVGVDNASAFFEKKLRLQRDSENVRIND